MAHSTLLGTTSAKYTKASFAVHLVHHYSKPDPKPISEITYHQKNHTIQNINLITGEIHNPSIRGNIHILTKRSFVVASFRAV